MPTNGRQPDMLVDTSVAVALCVGDHTHHDEVVRALRGQRIGLAGHAAFETFSVLTRLPPPARLTPRAAIRALNANFPHSRFLSAKKTAALLASLPSSPISGGAVYDALVGATAKEHQIILGTRDKRALSTYRALDVELKLIGETSNR